MIAIGAAVLQAVLDALRAEAAEHHAVHRADARARQHGDGRLRNHRHVDEHAVAGLDALCLEHIGELAHFHVKLRIGQAARVAGLAFPEDRHLVLAAVREVAVHAVLAHVYFGADEPFRERRLPVEHLGPLLLPVQFARLARPEGVRRVHRLRVQALVLFHAADAGLRLEGIARREDAVFSLEGFEVGAHG